MKRFKIAVPAADGGVAIYPMYPWLRSHPEELPPEVAHEALNDPTKMTSRMLRSIMTRAGWTVAETTTEVRLMPARFRGSPAEESLVDDAATDGQTEEATQPAVQEDTEVAFRMEQQLQHFVADNLKTVRINGRQIKPYNGDDGRKGLEYPTAVGRIDLLATDDLGGIVIFEFKRARAADAAMGQLTRYMGCVQTTIGQGKTITGVIVASTISDDLRYSAKMVPNVHLFEVVMSFALRPAQEVTLSTAN